MAYARIARTCDFAAGVRGVVQAVEFRAYAIRPYIYTACNQQATYTVYMITLIPKAVAFPNIPKTTWDMGKTTSYVEKIISDII